MDKYTLQSFTLKELDQLGIGLIFKQLLEAMWLTFWQTKNPHTEGLILHSDKVYRADVNDIPL